MSWRERVDGGSLSALAILLVVQSAAAVFFVADAAADLGESGLDLHLALEAAVAVSLVLGVVFGGLEMRRTIERGRRSETALAAASGALAEVIERHFEDWRLTPAEADVALFALKGFDVGEIAELRGAAPGTVRAQLARVYAKSGVSNRSQLVSVFIEDLLVRPAPSKARRGVRSNA